MPSFDISSELNKVALSNAIDVAHKQVVNRYDFKGTSAAIEFNDADSVITVFGDNDFQLDQVKAILLPAMEKKEPDSSKRLDHQPLQKISGDKVKQALLVKAGIDKDLTKKLLKLIKDSKLKVQASIQGEAVRVNGAKRDVLQEAIALCKKNVTDYPLQFGNFRD